jgi:hypothetical protein
VHALVHTHMHGRQRSSSAAGGAAAAGAAAAGAAAAGAAAAGAAAAGAAVAVAAAGRMPQRWLGAGGMDFTVRGSGHW